MHAWDSNLQVSWDTETWHKNFFQAYRGIHNTALIEAYLKVVTRWYLVPTRSSSPLCATQGFMLHICWECPKSRGFWNRIFHMIRKVTGCQIPKDLSTPLLNDHIPDTNRATQDQFFFRFLGAKLTIARAKRKISWKMAQEKMVNGNPGQLL